MLSYIKGLGAGSGRGKEGTGTISQEENCTRLLFTKSAWDELYGYNQPADVFG
jgi:hypothetical protein